MQTSKRIQSAVFKVEFSKCVSHSAFLKKHGYPNLEGATKHALAIVRKSSQESMKPAPPNGYPQAAASGMKWDGVPFVPVSRTDGKRVAGFMLVTAWRRGMTPNDTSSSTPSYYFYTYIQRSLHVVYEASTRTLTIDFDHTNATSGTIHYRYAGDSTQNLYTDPIVLPENTVTELFVSGALNPCPGYSGSQNMMYLNPQNIALEAIDTNPETATASFDKYVANEIKDPGYEAREIWLAVRFEKDTPVETADWYIAPGATGDGLTPQTPADPERIIGTNLNRSTIRGVIFAKAGTYEVFNIADNFLLNRPNTILKGGFNSDYTERNPIKYKTLFRGRQEGTNANPAAFGCNNNTNSYVDGCWFEHYARDTYVEYSDYRGIKPYIVSGYNYRNCYIDIDLTGNPGSGSFSPSDGLRGRSYEGNPGEGICITSRGTFYNSTIKIKVKSGRGADAPNGEDAPYDPDNPNIPDGGGGYSTGGAGGFVECNLTDMYVYNSEVIIELESGDNGNAGNAGNGSASLTSGSSYPAHRGNGGSSRTSSESMVALKGLYLSNCIGKIHLKSGRSGNSGSGGSGGDADAKPMNPDANPSQYYYVLDGGHGGSSSVQTGRMLLEGIMSLQSDVDIIAEGGELGSTGSGGKGGKGQPANGLVNQYGTPYPDGEDGEDGRASKIRHAGHIRLKNIFCGRVHARLDNDSPDYAYFDNNGPWDAGSITTTGDCVHLDTLFDAKQSSGIVKSLASAAVGSRYHVLGKYEKRDNNKLWKWDNQGYEQTQQPMVSEAYPDANRGLPWYSGDSFDGYTDPGDGVPIDGFEEPGKNNYGRTATKRGDFWE